MSKIWKNHDHETYTVLLSLCSLSWTESRDVTTLNGIQDIALGSGTLMS